MGLDLTPRDYLEMLTDEYREYRDNRLSMRKAITAAGSPTRCPKLSPPIAIPPILRKISRTSLTPTANSYDGDAKLITPFETFASTASM
jgi:hypothetical protein